MVALTVQNDPSQRQKNLEIHHNFVTVKGLKLVKVLADVYLQMICEALQRNAAVHLLVDCGLWGSEEEEPLDPNHTHTHSDKHTHTHAHRHS